MADDYPKDTGQTLAEWLDEWAAMEAARIAKATRGFPAWLASRDKSRWTERTPEQNEAIWAPFKGGIGKEVTNEN